MVRLLSPEPKIARLLKERKTILPRGKLRMAMLDFLEDVEKKLRNREAWVDTTATVTMQTVVAVALSYLLALFGVETLKRR